MPVKFVVVEKPVRKRLQKLPRQIHQRVIEALNQIKANPLYGEKLHGELSAYYKLRIGDYRIVYRFNSEKSLVEVVKIEHRQGVYR